ncbi:aberrant root formation protein 4 isoform X2 [Prosopis cineraria]|uniref:aberrant root formation protein 4 isoform X2 n=1 Tax=Prosopis cineraria TaxID=364024 RepID=UPI0024101081|nr:aberrant root formation protein 4 isoform X2 [Prosopis cineraria]
MSAKEESPVARNDVLHLRGILESFFNFTEAEDFHQYENTISELVKLLDSVLDAALSYPDNEQEESNAFEVVSEIYRHICSPSLDQALVDALSFELPKAVSKFAAVSLRLSDMAISIINQLIVVCGPRDMLPILCNALGYSSKMVRASAYVVPPFSGLSKVFTSIQRRQFEQIKEAIPIILNVLKNMSLQTDDAELEGVFGKAVEIANSIRAICAKMESGTNEKLRALLGLYALQCMALLSASSSYKSSTCHSLVIQLSHIISFCGLSYPYLLTSYNVDIVASFVFGVIWGYVSKEVSEATKEDLDVIKNELCSAQTKRWEALGTLKHALSFVNLPWELKRHTINFLLCVIDGHVPDKHDDELYEWSTYMPNVFSALQAIVMVIMCAPDTDYRKKAFDLLKRVLDDIHISQRFDILQALIRVTNSSSMIAILIDLVRKEMHMEVCHTTPTEKTEGKARPNTSFWTPSVLELVELVLRPPQGGPPSLPEQGDAVLSALNLYRFVLMTESTGNTNHTGVVSRSSLQKAYSQWLLPLRTLVAGIMSENTNDYDQLAVDTVCTLNPLELVLYRCIELVEEKLKQSS